MIVSRRVEISSELRAADAVRALQARVRPLVELPRFGGVDQWAVFGEATETDVRLQAAGPFHGWSSRSGFALWQPQFRGRVVGATNGSTLVGAVRSRWAWRIFVAVVAYVGTAFLLAVVPRVLAAVASGALSDAAVFAVWLVVIVGIPSLGILFVLRLQAHEVDEPIAFLTHALSAGDRSTGR